jgi:transposase
MGLECRDVDLNAGVLTVRPTKFGRSRLVPSHVTTSQHCLATPDGAMRITLQLHILRRRAGRPLAAPGTSIASSGACPVRSGCGALVPGRTCDICARGSRVGCARRPRNHPRRRTRSRVDAPGRFCSRILFKCGLHLPLNRQNATYAREGMDLDVWTLADWVGAAAATLMPLILLIRAFAFAAERTTPMTPPCLCWRRARRALAACGPMCGTIGRLAVRSAGKNLHTRHYSSVLQLRWVRPDQMRSNFRGPRASGRVPKREIRSRKA